MIRTFCRYLHTPLRIEYSARTRGWTWKRLGTTWAGTEDVCYAWGRMPLRIVGVWVFAGIVAAVIGYGVGWR